MSILIKGMRMPEDCVDCNCSELYGDGYLYCELVDKRFECAILNGERPSDCPLIEVPDGHGRLIDADALKSYMKECKIENAMVIYATGYARGFINNAPTIIPADEEKE